MYHKAVLLEQSVDLLDIREGGVYVDVTFGGGGHSREILGRLGRRGRLISFDQDIAALGNIIDDSRFTLIHNNFRFMRPCLRAMGIDKVDGILADLGVSSHHFDTPDRGFSFRFDDQPLDMRMNQSGSLTASDIVNGYDLERLATLLGRYGELSRPFHFAKIIEAARPILTTSELVSVVGHHVPVSVRTKTLSKLFQALRIEVNGELVALEMMLLGSLGILREGGVLSVISYHSLEDRMVKNFMRSGGLGGVVERDFYGCSLSPFELINRRVIEPTGVEVGLNSRSRSAKLRGARFIGTHL